MGGKTWDHVEDSTLRVWCDQESCEQLAERLGRSVGSVKARLQTLRIKKKNIYQNKTWTKEMETFLKSRAGQQSPKSIAKKLGVSRTVLRLKASRLGVSLRVHKNRLWSEGEIDLLLRQVQKTIHNPPSPHLSWDNISKVVGRSPHSCRKKASELGLTLELKKEWKTTELKFIHNSRLIGMSYKSIANKLNRTESSVRKRYARYKKESNLT
jgi:DNA-binding CsgD family transcriptional regulator